MAIYIEIFKIDKDDINSVYYSYQFYIPGVKYISTSGKMRNKPKKVSGLLKIDKKTGHVDILEFAESDQGFYALRAAVTLIKHWQKGEFPDKTCRAS